MVLCLSFVSSFMALLVVQYRPYWLFSIRPDFRASPRARYFYFVVGLKYFAGYEPGRILQIRLDIVLTRCIHAESLSDLSFIQNIIIFHTESFDHSIHVREKSMNR